MRKKLDGFRSALLGAGAAGLALATTTALAGSGWAASSTSARNSVDAPTLLSGNPGANP